MRASILPPLTMLCMFTGAANAQPVTYTLDPDHSFVHFEVRHFGTSTTRGRFGPFNGEVTLDRRAGTGSLSLRIGTAGIDTGLAFFNARLRQDDFLDSEAHPEAVYVGRGFRFDGDRLVQVDGELTLRGITQPLTLKARRFACRQDPADGSDICGGDFEGFVYRTPFGMVFGWPFVGNRVDLVVQVEGRRAPP